MIGNAIVTVILATVGLLVFGEHLSLTRGAGLGLAITGAILLALE